MNSTTYTPQQCSDVVQLYAAVQSNPPDRQTIITGLPCYFVVTAEIRRKLRRISGRSPGAAFDPCPGQ